MLEIGTQYKDGWGKLHQIGGFVTGRIDWMWSIQGNWYRRSDGRFIAYVLKDKSKPDGERRHEPATKASNWDIVIPKEGEGK